MDNEEPPDADVDELWSEEAERRWREIEAGTVKTIPSDEVRTELFRDFGKVRTRRDHGPEETLEALVARITPENRHDAVQWGTPVGNEFDALR